MSTFEAQPHENLQLVLQRKTAKTEALVGMPLVPMPGWQEAQRNFGLAGFASHQDAFSAVLQRLQALQKQVDTNALLLGRPRLCNEDDDDEHALLYCGGDKPQDQDQEDANAVVITRRNNECQPHHDAPGLPLGMLGAGQLGCVQGGFCPIVD